jgi:hypothetical protein
VADKADSCVNEPGSPNCSGCPDKDSDGVSDSLDQCPEEEGLKIYRGCPEIQDSPTMDDAQKLQNGEAVMVPLAFGNYLVTKKWLRLKNNRYEYSDYEKTAYKPVSKNETVEKLNAFYGLRGIFEEQSPKTKVKQTKLSTNDKRLKELTDKLNSSAGLTNEEQRELKDLNSNK